VGFLISIFSEIMQKDIEWIQDDVVQSINNEIGITTMPPL